MGVPDVKELWDTLKAKSRQGEHSRTEALLDKKWSKALRFLAQNPRHPGLASHEIAALSRRYGERVWQSYLENDTPRAGWMLWICGPGKAEITVIGIEPRSRIRKAPPAQRCACLKQERKNADGL
jgi:hypothetical protein